MLLILPSLEDRISIPLVLLVIIVASGISTINKDADYNFAYYSRFSYNLGIIILLLRIL